MVKSILFGILFIIKLDTFVQTRTVFVNINSKLFTTTGPIDLGVPTNCSNLSKFLNGSRITVLPPSSIYCNDTVLGIEFYIFVFNNSFRPYLVTVKSSANQSKEHLLSYGKTVTKNSIYNLFVATNESDYTIYFICQFVDTFCQPRPFNYEIYLSWKSLLQELYSPCSTVNCSSQLDFSGNNILLKPVATFKPVKEICDESFCLNGGSCKKDDFRGFGLKCDCVNLYGGMEHGPRCESLDKSLNKSFYYFNILGNSPSLKIEFELFSPSFKNTYDIIKIPKWNSNNPVIQYSQSESYMNIRIGQNMTQLKSAIDINTWTSITIFLSNESTYLEINGNRKMEMAKLELDLNLDAMPLILGDSDNVISVCLKKLKINNQIVDLYGECSCCADRCSNCKQNSDCICTPFKSDEFTHCRCKFGFSEPQCFADNITTDSINIRSPTTSVLPLSSSNQKVNAVTNLMFRYRTLSKNGILAIALFLTPLNHSIYLRVDNEAYNMTVYSPWKPAGVNGVLNAYNASDGNWHIINLELQHRQVSMILDENPLLSFLQLSNWTNESVSFSMSTISIGPMIQTNENRSTCYVSMTMRTSIESVSLQMSSFSNSTVGCSSGPDCTNHFCGLNSNCISETWQEPKCTCLPTFYFYNGSCTNACQNVICNNGGKCVVHEATNTYSCNCPLHYSGKHCDNNMLLWLLLLLLLLPLILLVILVCIFCRKCRKAKTDETEINKVTSNYTVYDDTAGEQDFAASEIDMNILRAALKNTSRPPEDETGLSAVDLALQKDQIDKGNKGLVIDYPLDYGYEGCDSDNQSVSSLGSGSTDSQLNTESLDKNGNNLNYIKSLYR